MKLLTHRGVDAASTSVSVTAFGSQRVKWPRGRAWCAVILLLAMAGGLAASAPEEAPKRPALTTFNVISERNIFNSSRSGRSARNDGDENQVRVETITLVGTLTYEKGPFAFFDGSSSDYRQVLEPGKSIAGYTVSAIKGDLVKLTAGTNSFDLRIGMQLRREEEGEWKVTGDSFVQAASSSGGSSVESSATDDNDVVKRLMQQREQDLK